MTELQTLLNNTSAALNRVEVCVSQYRKLNNGVNCPELQSERAKLYVVLDTLLELTD
jgi:hypothetical protein